MATSVVPALIDALVDQASAALPDHLVLDGFGNTEDPGDFLMIGVDDPDTEVWATSADSSQEWPHVGHTTRDEDGEVTCCALSWNGDGDQKAARDAVYATTAALEDLLRADPTLGIPGLLWTGFGSTSALVQAQGEDGAAAQLNFKIAFRARI